MPEAVPLHLVVAHLGDELGPQRLLLERPAAPAVRLREAAIRRVLEQRQHLLGDGGLPARGDGGRADVVDLAVVAIQAEQQRRDPCRLLLPAEADDHAVRGALGLHLHDRAAAAGLDRPVDALRDHSVEAECLQLVQPRERRSRVRGRRGELERPGVPLERLAAPRKGALPDRRSVPQQHVEGDEPRRDLGGQLADAALGGMEPHLHGVEVDRSVPLDHDLAVERRAGRQQVAERLRARGSSAAAAARCATRAAARRPRSRARRGSRPTSARTPSLRRAGSSRTSSASIGGNGTSGSSSSGRSGASATPINLLRSPFHETCRHHRPRCDHARRARRALHVGGSGRRTERSGVDRGVRRVRLPRADRRRGNGLRSRRRSCRRRRRAAWTATSSWPSPPRRRPGPTPASRASTRPGSASSSAPRSAGSRRSPSSTRCSSSAGPTASRRSSSPRPSSTPRAARSRSSSVSPARTSRPSPPVPRARRRSARVRRRSGAGRRTSSSRVAPRPPSSRSSSPASAPCGGSSRRRSTPPSRCARSTRRGPAS